MADYATYGYDKAGNHIPLQQVTFETQYGPSHGHGDFFSDYDNGKNDGFYDNNGGTAGSTGNGGLAYLDQHGNSAILRHGDERCTCRAILSMA